MNDFDLDDTLEIGYEEDCVVWVTRSPDVPDAEAAERFVGPGWKAVEEVWLGPTGHMVNHKDPAWDECPGDAPGARPGWRLVLISEPELYMDGAWRPNPHYRQQAN